MGELNNKLLEKRFLSAITVFMIVVFMSSSFAFAQPANLVSDDVSGLSSEYAQYLEYKYGIKVPDVVTRSYFIESIDSILDVQREKKYTDTKEQFTTMEAVCIAVEAANLKELALTYPETKVFETLKKTNLLRAKAKYSSKELQYLATAIDTGLLPLGKTSVKLDEKIDKQTAVVLLGNIASFNGKYKNFLGYISDNDIYNKINKTWESFDLIKAEKLREIVDTGLRKNIITGYNLKDIRYNPDFVPERTITYGHSDIKHAIQLIALLKSEGIDAKVQLEPKTSAFIYLKEWGEPVETPDYKVRKIENGNYIAYAKEYDISFEFNTIADKKRFNHIILTYAKKNEEGQKGIIYDSWWQPLYYSMDKLDGFRQIANNYIIEGNYLVQSFTTVEDSIKVVKGFKNINPNIKVGTYKFWVNDAFYGYLVGEDYK